MPDLSPEILTALIAAIVALIVGFVAAYFASRGAEKRLKEKYESEISPERMAKQIFLLRRTKTVPIAVFREHVGGIHDDELRRVLLGSGAVRFVTKTGDEEWGLLSRNKSRVSKSEGLVAINATDDHTHDVAERNESPSEDTTFNTSEESTVADVEEHVDLTRPQQAGTKLVRRANALKDPAPKQARVKPGSSRFIGELDK